ncbi:MAG: spermidine synthase [Microlunatus sp.]|nr:spermidine synthase [Microlunatus sp.]
MQSFKDGVRRVSRRFEELAWEPTAIGEVSLRRRRDPVTGVDVFEVKLGDAYLMSSQFTVAEIALADLALGWLGRREIPTTGWEVVVGGLGLGYTAAAVLADDRVGQLVVVEALAPVISWHRRELVPLGRMLTTDPRCRLELGDFFAMVQEVGFDPEAPDRRFDAVLVDIDHSPRHQLGVGNTDFYAESGLGRLAARLTPDGVFGLWSNDPPDQDYLDVLRAVFTTVSAEVVAFPNPLQQRQATSTVYLASGTKTT